MHKSIKDAVVRRMELLAQIDESDRGENKMM